MFDRLKNLLRRPRPKTSRTARLIRWSGGRARWTPRDYAALAREGYVCNAIVHRAVKLVAENVAACDVPALRGRGAARPRIRCSICWRGPIRGRTARRFSRRCYAHLLLAGNAYVEAVAVEGAVRELYALRPDRMRVVPGAGRLAGGLRICGRRRAPCASIRARRCRRSCISRNSIRSTITTA